MKYTDGTSDVGIDPISSSSSACLSLSRVFHRYIDDIFFTSNVPLNIVNQMLDVADRHHPNIRLVRHVGKQVSFLDVLIENDHGSLTTSVYRKEAAEPYLVPFNSDHPRHIFRNMVEGMLSRAIRYSSTLCAFDTERRSIQLMLLYNGFVSCFIFACR
jgi:hypothetical protein